MHDGSILDLGASTTTAHSINRWAQIVGDPTFLYSDGLVQNLSSLIDPSFTLTTANGINDKGQIIGTALTSDGNEHSVVLTDATAPDCQVTGSGTNASGQPFIAVALQDNLSGLSTVHATTADNAKVSFPTFTKGTPRPLSATVTKVRNGRSSRVVFALTDIAGNTISCTQTF